MNQLLREAEQPLFTNLSGLLFRSLYGQNFYDQQSIPYMPNLNAPELVDLLEQWNQIFNVDDPKNINQQPIVSIASLPTQSGGTPRSYTLLPNGYAGISTQGLAVSNGTAYPELAYALIQHLTASPEFPLNQLGNMPARVSVNQTINTEYLPDDIRALQEVAVHHALSASDRLYTDYLLNVMSALSPNASRDDISASLQRAEDFAWENTNNALEISQTLTLSITPPSQTIQDVDAVTLHFGRPSTDYSTEERWQQAVAEFIEQDLLVTDITTTTIFSHENTAELDCFYLHYNAVPNLDLSQVLALNPLMDADPNFNREDFIGGVLSQVQHEGNIWAYPIDISPSVLWYNRDRLNQYGIPEPINGWTATEFALQTLFPETGAVVTTQQGSDYLYSLIATYGGFPFDYRQTPPTINFTDPKTVEAIRHVLDMARNDIIRYLRLYIPPEGAPAWAGGGDFSIYAGVLDSRPQSGNDN